MKLLVDGLLSGALLIAGVSAFGSDEGVAAELEDSRRAYASSFVDGCAAGIVDSKLPGMLATANAAGQPELTLKQFRASFLAGWIPEWSLYGGRGARPSPPTALSQ